MPSRDDVISFQREEYGEPRCPAYADALRDLSRDLWRDALVQYAMADAAYEHQWREGVTEATRTRWEDAERRHRAAYARMSDEAYAASAMASAAADEAVLFSPTADPKSALQAGIRAMRLLGRAPSPRWLDLAGLPPYEDPDPDGCSAMPGWACPNYDHEIGDKRP